MAKKRISRGKKIHEASGYIRAEEARIYDYIDIIAYIDTLTVRIAPDGTGSIYMPSIGIFEHINPLSPPQGIVFNDNSFLVFKEIFRYDYPSEKVAEPEIIKIEYHFHFQMPRRRFFFRYFFLLFLLIKLFFLKEKFGYDFHPEIGDRLTHPLHHLHAGGWLNETDTLPSVPRFPVSEVSLGDVLELIQVNFF